MLGAGDSVQLNIMRIMDMMVLAVMITLKLLKPSNKYMQYIKEIHG